MGAKTQFGILATSFFALSAAGCVVEETEVGVPETAKQMQEGSGQDPLPPELTEGAYPDSWDWGFAVGEIIPNMKFLGRANIMDPSLIGFQVLKLSDFYNPTGAEVFPAGSPWAGQPKPKALDVIISSLWCSACRAEAKEMLPGKYATLKPLGGHFITVLIDGAEPGEAANLKDLDSWANQYKIEYSVVIDPAEKVMPLYEPAFPGNLLVRTKDMRIIARETGVPPEGFWTTFAAVLDGTYEDPPPT
jgi:hypothetical protein